MKSLEKIYIKKAIFLPKQVKIQTNKVKIKGKETKKHSVYRYLHMLVSNVLLYFCSLF